MNKLINISLVVFSLLLVVSCGTRKASSKGESTVSLERTSWQLTESVKGQIPTLKVESGVISGNAGCNSYTADVQLNPIKGEFSTGVFRTTRKACRNMQGENSFLQMIKKVDHYKVENNILKLYNNKVLLLKFKKN